MKKSIVYAMIALLSATMALADTDWTPQLKDAKIFRIALGSGTAPTAANAKYNGIQAGDMIENTDDGVLYIMSATNVYTKISAAGAVTLTSLASVGDITGNLNVSGAITSGTAKVTGNAVVGNGLTVNTNATVGGTLAVTGVTTLVSTPILNNGISIRTNAVIGGTLTVTGNTTVATLTASKPVFSDGSKILVSTGTLGLDQGGTAATTAGAARTNLALVIGTDVQAYDADLTTWAGVTPSDNGKSLVAFANYATMRTNLSLVVGTDVLAPTGNGFGLTTLNATNILGVLPNASAPASIASSTLSGALPAISGVALTALDGTNVGPGVAAANVAGTALTQATTFAGGVTGLYNNLTVSSLPAISGVALTAINGTNVGPGMAAANITGYVATDANPADIVVTTNIPLFAGQWLIGTVSNRVWLSTSTSTNSWVNVK